MMVDALRQGGSVSEADALLDTLNAAYPDSPEAHLARAEMKLALNLPEEAATACRQARKVAAPGSVPWCRATLQLATALRAAGHEDAAADILRVSGALYPAFGNAELKAELKRLVGEGR
jgi:predicted Zn-dependent protease